MAMNTDIVFDGPSVDIVVDGFLFDLDGTLIDSTPAIIKHWHKLGKQLGVDPEVILKTSHGRRSIDTLKQYDESLANWEYVKHVEGLIPKESGSDAKEILGAREILDKLTSLGAPWAIVTSGTEPLMSGWLEVMKFPMPKVCVTAEDVEAGKPDPQCYNLGRKRAGLGATADVLVVEDAPAGVKAGKASGAKVLGLATTHTVDSLKQAGADFIVKDLRSIAVRPNPGSGFRVELSDTYPFGRATQ